MNFIKKTFNIKIKYNNDEQKYPLPNYMLSRYIIKSAFFDKQRVILLYPKIELDEINTIKKHIEKVQSYDKVPVVLVLDKITVKERQGMLNRGIPFIVENKQCYLPFLGMLLTERCDTKIQKSEKILPSAQMLLFYYIYSNQKELFTNTAVKEFGVSAMTITRAVRGLEQTGLIRVYKSGVQKVMTSDYTKKELYEKAKPFLSSPIKRTVYIPDNQVDDSLLYAGDQALSFFSMLNQPRIDCYATANDNKWKGLEKTELIDDREQVVLQLWKYNPRVLTKGKYVDILSLAACYMDDADERVEACIEGMLDEYWRNINGQRL